MESDMRSPKFETAKVLTIGDAMIDRYWHGVAKRISAEAPIPVVEVTEIEDRPVSYTHLTQPTIYSV